MDSARSRTICRSASILDMCSNLLKLKVSDPGEPITDDASERFINGSCRFGSRCNYRHEWPVTPSAQICRYFQKGGCWFGECCRYLHVIQPEVDAAVTSRRSSVPTVSSFSVTSVQPERRGSEPALQAEAMSRQECSRSEMAVHVPNPQLNTERKAADIAEEQSQVTACGWSVLEIFGCQCKAAIWRHTERREGEDTDSDLTVSAGLAQSSETAHAYECEGRNEQETSSHETADEGAAAAAAASITQAKVEEIEAVGQSESVTCGICMDRVYEKTDPKKRVFGILPNCNHSFCLQCIRTWRKTKAFGLDVVKSCPQCRVRSAFYVPNKYWVEGQAKESVIAEFKEKLSKKSCGYYSRYRRCPFKEECLYRHDKHARRTSFPYPTEDEDDEDYYDGVDLLNFYIAMTLLSGSVDSDDDDDEDLAFYLSGEYGF